MQRLPEPEIKTKWLLKVRPICLVVSYTFLMGRAKNPFYKILVVWLLLLTTLCWSTTIRNRSIPNNRL
jgi:hypothetical protein